MKDKEIDAFVRRLADRARAAHEESVDSFYDIVVYAMVKAHWRWLFEQSGGEVVVCGHRVQFKDIDKIIEIYIDMLKTKSREKDNEG